jgi:hypothetical protein
MNKLLNKLALVAVGMLVGMPAAWAGPVVVDGTDANDHGQTDFTGTQNEEGWLYMQKVLENLAPQVGNGNTTVVSLGTDPNTTAYDAINSAFSKSAIASTWNFVNINGATDIASFLGGSSVGGNSLANTGILYIPTANNAFGDLEDDELAEINSRGAAINNFVGGAGNPNQGGALFAMAESPSSFSVTPYGWLTSLLPSLTVNDVGASTPITLTSEGQAAFPGLTTADLSAGPWHNYFTGNFGGLKVLATAADNNGVVQPLILGGGAGTVITPPPPTGVPEPASVVGILAFGAFGVGSQMKRKQQHKQATSVN